MRPKRLPINDSYRRKLRFSRCRIAMQMNVGAVTSTMRIDEWSLVGATN